MSKYFHPSNAVALPDLVRMPRGTIAFLALADPRADVGPAMVAARKYADACGGKVEVRACYAITTLDCSAGKLLRVKVLKSGKARQKRGRRAAQ